MADIDQKERADAYHSNLIAIIFCTRVEYEAHLRDHGETIEAANIRNRLRSLVATVEAVEAGNYHTNCEACGKPLLDGHMVVYYDDAGSVHADCDEPTKFDPDAQAYDSGFGPDDCVRELSKAKAALDEVDV